jgi:O-acetyl-ADP-ribose deacetylase (regulator of RNase III)
MNTAIHGIEVELVLGDITNERTDAIVNAANSRLAGGGGVDGAIHRAGGPNIMQETRAKYPDGCPTGGAVITGAGKLPAQFVIHAVGPVYRDGKHGEPQLLASAYRSCLEAAVKAGCRSIAFPSLSTGAYGYPVEEAAPVAVQTVADSLKATTGLTLVRFVLFDQPSYDAFAAAVKDWQLTSRN